MPKIYKEYYGNVKVANQYYLWIKGATNLKGGGGERGGEGHKENGEVRSHPIPSTRVKCTPKTPTLQDNNRV